MSILTTEFDTRSVEAFLNRLGSVALSDGVKRAVAEGMLSATVKSFESEQSPNGVAWAPLAFATKRKKKGRGSILR
ncbi:phage virion morphogenesis protein, partial [Lacticaseibacillus paracasei]